MVSIANVISLCSLNISGGTGSMLVLTCASNGFRLKRSYTYIESVSLVERLKTWLRYHHFSEYFIPFNNYKIDITMRKVVPVIYVKLFVRSTTLVLLCSLYASTAFTGGRFTSKSSKSNTKIMDMSLNENVLKISMNDKVDCDKILAKSLLNRRDIMKHVALSTLLLSGVSSANAASLEDIEVGGRWVPLKEITSREQESSSSSLLADSVNASIPSYFGVYLSRILLNFDPAAKEWWESKLDEYSLLSSSEIRYKLGRDFASFAASVQNGVEQFVLESAKGREGISDCEVKPTDFEYLGNVLLEKYADNALTEIDINRQIGLLFSLLPIELQPISLLNNLHDKVQPLVSSSDVTLPVGFSENELLLLSEDFNFGTAGKNNYYQISPPIILWEIGVGEEFDQAVGTVFGPRSFEPLRRNTPNIQFDVYKLLALSGAAACSVTHTFVIPLDVVSSKHLTFLII